MSKWIDADALKAVYEPYIGKELMTPVENILSWIDEVPSIDIVRCKECKYSEKLIIEKDAFDNELVGVFCHHNLINNTPWGKL